MQYAAVSKDLDKYREDLVVLLFSLVHSRWLTLRGTSLKKVGCWMRALAPWVRCFHSYQQAGESYPGVLGKAISKSALQSRPDTFARYTRQGTSEARLRSALNH